MKAKNKKLLEENKRKICVSLKLGIVFLDTTPQAQETKEK